MSLQYRVLLAYLRFSKWMASREPAAHLHLRASKLAQAVSLPSSRSLQGLTASTTWVAGFPVWSIQRADCDPAARSTPGRGGAAHVIYLHGGGYVAGITSFHWRFIADMVRASGCVAHVPLYPRAPAYTHEAAYRFCQAVYKAVSSQAAGSPLVLMGDSAGGGLAVGLTQCLAGMGLRLPELLILNAPWLDLDLTHADIANVEVRDPWLSSEQLRAMGRLWAGGVHPSHPWLSPLHGDMQTLPPTHVFVGDRDIFLPDAREFAKAMHAHQRECHLHVGEGMCHVWPLLPVPEARQAVRQIHQLVAAR